MKIDLLKIITDAKNIYCRQCAGGICTAIKLSILLYDDHKDYVSVHPHYYASRIENHIKKIHKPPKYYYPLRARDIAPYNYGYWWKLNDVESRLKRFNEYIEYFKKPENRYLEV